MSAAILPLPQYIFMAWCLVKHRDKFTFTFTFTLQLNPILSEFNTVHTFKAFFSKTCLTAVIVKATDLFQYLFQAR
jgi:hypothetical protein